MSELRIIEQLPSDSNEVLAVRFCAEEAAMATFALAQLRGDEGLTMEDAYATQAVVESKQGTCNLQLASATVGSAELAVTYPDSVTEKILFNSVPELGQKYIEWQRYHGDKAVDGANDKIDDGVRDLAQELADLRNFNAWLEALCSR